MSKPRCAVAVSPIPRRKASATPERPNRATRSVTGPSWAPMLLWVGEDRRCRTAGPALATRGVGAIDMDALGRSLGQQRRRPQLGMKTVSLADGLADRESPPSAEGWAGMRPQHTRRHAQYLPRAFLPVRRFN